MKKLLIITLLSVSIPLRGQSPDSLLRLAESLPALDTQRVNLLNEAAMAFWRSGHDSVAVALHLTAIEKAKQFSFPEGEIRARLQLVVMEMDYLTDLKTAYAHLDSSLSLARKTQNRNLEGQTYFRRAQIYSLGIWEFSDQVKPLYNQALTIFKETNDAVREGMVYAQLAALASDEGRFAVAIDYLLRAKRLQEASGDAKSLRATLPNLGVMYMSIGLFDQALQCFDEAEKNALKTQDERVLAFLAGQRGEAYLRQQQPRMALEELERAVEKYHQLGSVQFLTGTYARMGEAYLKMGKNDKALAYALRADSLFKAITDGANLLSHPAQILLGDVYLQDGRYSQVIRLAEKGLEWAEDADPVLLKEASEYHRQLAEAFEKSGRAAKALFHQKRLKSTSDSLLNSEMIQRVTASSLTYDFEKAKQADELRIQSLENKNLIQTRNITIVLFVIGWLALGFVVWINRRLKQKNDALAETNRAIERALVKGQTIERKRVASELHDSLNTKIAGIRWQLESLEQSDLNEYNQKIVRQLLDITGDAYDDIRLIAHNMVPAELESKGLNAAIRRLVMQLDALHGLTLTLQTHLSERLPLEVEQQLYHITLELVNNVIKHAHASSLVISLERTKRGIVLTVQDNGVGFSGGKPANGVGLKNIVSRAASLGGACEIENLKTGTVVRIIVPENIDKQMTTSGDV